MSAYNVKMQGFMTENGQETGMMIFNFDNTAEVQEFKKRIITAWQQMVDEQSAEKVMSIIPLGKQEAA
jgi:phage regulator Rha-like protein